jgi:hypothetical protein
VIPRVSARGVGLLERGGVHRVDRVRRERTRSFEPGTPRLLFVALDAFGRAGVAVRVPALEVPDSGCPVRRRVRGDVRRESVRRDGRRGYHRNAHRPSAVMKPV